jgi:Putative DNA-binding domain
MLSLPNQLTDLIQFDAGSGAVSSRESKRLELKENFNPADLSEYTKVLASFANASGGVILFGVSNHPRIIVGATGMADEADWVNRLRDDFEPEIPIAIREYQLEALTLYAVGVEPSPNKPVICKKSRSKQITDKKGVKKDVPVIHEGAVYHRYTGQTRTISFTDLQTMLADRDAQYLRKMMETLQVIQKVGLENAGIVDVSAQKSRIYMSKETAKGLTLIDKGQLVQEKGSPAYVVMGNVDLEQVVHAPLDEADKNLPSEVAKMLLPLVKRTYSSLTGISPSQVTQLLKHLGIDGDNHHCVLERKFRRKFVTRAGIDAITNFIQKEPTEALRAFGSRHANAKFALQNSVVPPIEMPMVVPPDPTHAMEIPEAASPEVVKH